METVTRWPLPMFMALVLAQKSVPLRLPYATDKSVRTFTWYTDASNVMSTYQSSVASSCS